ncbi:MAG: CHAD domain-containing protein [Betaproteobacteria bacterium]|nr:CHAD domain-containing protein [Betaproteobacteria bacterium]
MVASNPDLNFTAGMRVDETVRAIMQRLLAMMNANVVGVQAGVDPEFLHNFRIAVRRQHVLLGQIRGVMPQRNRRQLSRGFAWLNELTGRVRDLDVYLCRLEADKTRLGPATCKDLAPLYEFLQHRQQLAHQQLVESLNSRRYIRLIAAWTAYLASPLPVCNRLPDARCSLPSFANRRIWHMLRRVMKQGNAIRAHSPPQDLHALRKSCKKLRYLIEFFQSGYSAIMLKQPLNVLKSLQDVLGEYQDLQVQQAFLVTFRQQAPATPVMKNALCAIKLMRRRLEKRKIKVRKSFKQHFAALVETRQQKTFNRLFNKMKGR